MLLRGYDVNTCFAERINARAQHGTAVGRLPMIKHSRRPPIPLVRCGHDDYRFEATLPQRVVIAERHKKCWQVRMIHQTLCKPSLTFLPHTLAHDFE